MEYRGFHEEALLAAAKELDALGLKPSEIYAVMNLAGAKWRSVQIQKGRGHESHDELDSRVFHVATESVMKSTMAETMQLGKLGHATEGEKFMFLAISLTLSRLYARDTGLIGEWLKDGDEEARKIILSFAIGSCIIVEAQVIDFFFSRMVKFRYGSPFDSGKDISDSIIASITRLGKAGYSILNPISDTQE